MYPKLVALDTDGTIFTGQLDQNVWDKGPAAAVKLADNIQRVDDFTLQDKTNHSNKIFLNKDIPRIVTDILEHGASLAVVSRNTSKTLCDRALYYFKAKNPKTGVSEPIIKLVRYDEVVDEPKTAHFKRIHAWSKYAYADMILFNSDPANSVVQHELGVTVQLCSKQTGLTWEAYSHGVECWRKNVEASALAPSEPRVLNIAHFNDVYQVTDQKIYVDKKEEIINVAKFATLLSDVTAKWENKGDGHGKNGLIVFSGDLFSPSVESAITRGQHLPAIVNGLKVDIGVAGNHEFDFGFPRLRELVENTAFPWLLSNIIDKDTGKVPEPMQEFHILERAGVRIGLIGLVEQTWIKTIPEWPENFEYQDMAEVGRRLSVKLRDPAGEKCDLIIALTHSRIPNDIKLARALFALSPEAQKSKDIASEHGADLLLGGHDHVYWISKGVSHWDDFDLNTPQPDAADDQGDTLIVKSGTDYRDLSEIILVLESTPTGSVRKRVIHEIKGKRHVTRGSTPENEALKTIMDHELATVKAALKEPICITDVVLDNRSSEIRLHESAIGNWVADCLRPAYDEALAKLGHRKADGVIMCMGDFRGSETYMPGPITFGDLQGILFYPDPTVVVELDANTLWDTLESGLSLWPAQEGRFPSLSGLRVTFDGRRPAGQRILGVWLLEDTKVGADGKPLLADKEEVLRTSTGTYLIICGEYMVKGGDGYDVLKGKKLIISGENGQPKIALVRKFLLGAQFLNKKISDKSEVQIANPGTKVSDIVGKVKVHITTELPQSLLELPKVSLKDCLEFNLPSFSSSPGTSISPSNTGSLVNSPSLSSLSFLSANALSTHEGTCPTCGQRLPSGSHSREQVADAGDHKQSPVQAVKDTVQALPGVIDSIAHRAKETAHDPMVGIRWIASRALFTAALAIADHEDVGLLDSYEQSRSRQLAQLLRSANISVHLQMSLPVLLNSGDDALAVADKEEAKVNAAEIGAKRALPVIHPVVDGRLKNVATARAD